MTARLLATVCLFYVSAPTGRSESLAPAGEVDLYLKIDRGIEPAVLSSMETELASVMIPSGAHIEFRQLNGAQAGTTSGVNIVLDLRGECGVAWHADWATASSEAGPLASSAVSDGEILPFSWIDCGVLSRLIGPAISDEPDALRDCSYGRALARVLAHELFHVLTQKSGHTESGLAKAKFTAADLLSESFQFAGDVFTIPPAAQLVAIPEAGAGSAEVDVTGRK